MHGNVQKIQKCSNDYITKMVARCNKIPPQARLQWSDIAFKDDYLSKK
jgi:hypothetical protein